MSSDSNPTCLKCGAQMVGPFYITDSDGSLVKLSIPAVCRWCTLHQESDSSPTIYDYQSIRRRPARRRLAEGWGMSEASDKREKSVGHKMSAHEIGVMDFRLAEAPWKQSRFEPGSADFKDYMRGYCMAAVAGHGHAEYDHVKMIGGVE